MSTTSDPRPAPQTPPFTGATIDRAAEPRQDPAQIAALLADAPLAVACDGADVALDSDGTRLARRPWQGDPADAVMLGIEDGHALVAVGLADLADPSAPTQSLRDAAGTLSQPEGGLAAYLVALRGWHVKHQFCSVCGSPTRVFEAGLARKCPDCGASHFPRTDPVVIMTVECDDQLLLGSRTGWDPDRYSVLAGFISPGETPEAAVVREVAEESGIVARDAVYVTSQPWPFPASLMLGFHAVADGGVPAPGGDGELSDVRWFSRSEVMAMERGEAATQLPPAVSIARLLIDRWVARTGD